ncbi:MAG: ROK family protein [Gammaproteobacteria bacterium]|nr:ROK family protein [Gammaproteobacteria bacterium]
MRIGIDLGGTKIEVIALDNKGVERYRQRTPTPAHDYHAILDAIQTLVTNTEHYCGTQGSVGVGIPGMISPATGLVKNANTTCLIGHPLQQDLGELLRRPVRVSNDANCFTVSEASDGAGQDADVVFGVIVGTGTGGGIAVHKQVISGVNAISGEWGHNPLPWPRADELPGPRCYCGKHACIETFLSGPGFSRDHQLHQGHGDTPIAILTRAQQGDVIAEASLQRYEDRMARALATIINVLDPEVIVLGGGMSNIQRLYDNVPQRWGQYVFSDQVATQLRPPVHGDSSGVRGAAWLWPVNASD